MENFLWITCHQSESYGGRIYKDAKMLDNLRSLKIFFVLVETQSQLFQKRSSYFRRILKIFLFSSGSISRRSDTKVVQIGYNQSPSSASLAQIGWVSEWNIKAIGPIQTVKQHNGSIFQNSGTETNIPLVDVSGSDGIPFQYTSTESGLLDERTSKNRIEFPLLPNHGTRE